MGVVVVVAVVVPCAVEVTENVSIQMQLYVRSDMAERILNKRQKEKWVGVGGGGGGML